MKIITPAIVGHWDKGRAWCRLGSIQLTLNIVAVKEMGLEKANQISVFFDDQDGKREKRIWIAATPKGASGFNILGVKKTDSAKRVRSKALMKHIAEFLEIENYPKGGITMYIDTAITVTNFGTTLYQVKK